MLVAGLTLARSPVEPLAVVVVGGRGDRQTMLGQHGADRLDTPPQAVYVTSSLVGADELYDQWWGRSSSALLLCQAAAAKAGVGGCRRARPWWRCRFASWRTRHLTDADGAASGRRRGPCRGRSACPGMPGPVRSRGPG